METPADSELKLIDNWVETPAPPTYLPLHAFVLFLTSQFKVEKLPPYKSSKGLLDFQSRTTHIVHNYTP